LGVKARENAAQRPPDGVARGLLRCLCTMTEDMIWAALGTVEEATTCVLTLAEGLSESALLGSRLTRREVRRYLLHAAYALAELGPDGVSALPELDWSGFRDAATGLQAGGAAEELALCAGVASLAPSTLSWIRLYKAKRAWA
jgi:hypothetical protein